MSEDTPGGSAPSSSPPRHQIIQDASNLALLARQAISNGFETMAVDPRVCANVAQLVRELTATRDEAPAPEDLPVEGMLDHAREEGRRQAIESFAQEKADLLTRIAALEAPATRPEDAMGQQVLPGVEDEQPLRGPGQG